MARGNIGPYSRSKLNRIIDAKVAAGGGGGGGSGDVTGPGSSTDNAITRFNGTAGKTLQNSGCTIDDSNNMTIAGDLTITGDDLFMNTNTSGFILVADGTNYNPVAANNIGAALISGQAAITVVDPAADYLLIWDATDSALKKVIPANLGIGSDNRNTVLAGEIFRR